MAREGEGLESLAFGEEGMFYGNSAGKSEFWFCMAEFGGCSLIII